jgi:hypothetical protein
VAIGVWGDPARCETEALSARLRALARRHPAPPGRQRLPGGRGPAGAVLEADRKPDGSLRQDNVFRYVLATK